LFSKKLSILKINKYVEHQKLFEYDLNKKGLENNVNLTALKFNYFTNFNENFIEEKNIKFFLEVLNYLIIIIVK